MRNCLNRESFEDFLYGIRNIRDKLIFLLFYELGLKPSELINIKIKDININSLQLNDRKLFFSEKLKIELKKYLAKHTPNNYLFFSRQSPRITLRRVEQILKNYDLNPSLLRKISIVNSLQNNPLQFVKEKYSIKSIRSKKLISSKDYKKTFVQISSKRDRLLFAFFYDLGLSVSQVSSLKKSDVKKKHIIVKKDDRTSFSVSNIKIEFGSHISELLSDYYSSRHFMMNPGKYLFSSRQSQQISQRRIEQIISSYSNIINHNISPQILANSGRAHSIQDLFSDSFSLYSQVSQKTVSNFGPARIYEGYYNKIGGDKEII